jgi:hypothetical protein
MSENKFRSASRLFDAVTGVKTSDKKRARALIVDGNIASAGTIDLTEPH